MADEQDQAEQLDAEEVGEIPPERPPGAQAYGAGGAEPHATEPVARRAAREQPEEVPPADPDQVDDPVEVLAPDDPAAGEPDRRDTTLERAEVPPAEAAALHEVDVDEPS